MRANFLTYKKLLSYRIILFVIITMIEILSLVFLFSGRLDNFLTLNDTLKALFGGCFGLSLTFSIFLLRTMYSDYKQSPEFRYENLLKETELKYSIFKEELEKQKEELKMMLKEQEKNELLRDRLFEIEKQSLHLQEEKFYEIRRLLEGHQINETIKNSH
jgi:hypothetical protein